MGGSNEIREISEIREFRELRDACGAPPYTP